MLMQSMRTKSPRIREPFGSSDDPPSLAALGVAVRFSRGTMIFNQGDKPHYAYRIVSGAVRHSKFLPDGRRQIADFSLAGEFFGLEGDHENGLTAEALTEVNAVSYPRSGIERLADDKPDIRETFLAGLREKLLHSHEHLMMLGRQTAKERIAAFLVEMAKRRTTDESMLVDLPMTRQDIADYLGLTIETVCREISDLKQAGIIDVPSRREIRVCELAALKARAQGA